MKHILLIGLSLSLSVIAIGSVGFAHASPPHVYEPPKIEKPAKVVLFTVDAIAPQLEAVKSFQLKEYFAELPVSISIVEHPQELAEAGVYRTGYGYQHRSMCNYWQGPPPYGNA